MRDCLRSPFGLRSQFHRRELLRAGLAGISGLSLADLFRLRSEAATATLRSGAATTAERRMAVILVWLPGGASHLETYDPKPIATSDYRGPFAAIDARVPGMKLCELLPRHAESPIALRCCGRWSTPAFAISKARSSF